MNLAGIGLDIGSRKIKIASVRKKRGSLEVINFGSRETPRGAVERGSIKDPDILGASIADLVTELGLRKKTVVTAVAGPQVYTRIISLPSLRLDELRKAVRYEATAFLPIPVEEAAMDIFPLREYQDHEGARVELFFVAVRQSQVEKIRTVCQLGKLKLQTIEIEPLALQRLLLDKKSPGAKAFLNMGATRWCFSVHQRGVPVFNRNFSFADSSYRPGAVLSFSENSPLMSLPRATDNVIKDLVNEVVRSSDHFRMQQQSEISKIFITGGGTRIIDLDKVIASATRCKVEVEDVLARVSLAEQLSSGELDELKHDFAVAVGLALRGGDAWWWIKK
ncbi:hypothetical protein ASZ90_017531 [hydrocarbon metagenome]|uniref:SHS2 domain-containing protein n=1 Tax=hydrocarbon metagenome TaxID=938273 RepID=A0A0W8E8U6_9ZZZZ